MHLLTHLRGRLVVALCLCLLAAPAARADGQKVYDRLLKSTGWINCPQPNGQNSWGTCWVYDAKERLVVTNQHVVDAATKVMVDFPFHKNGKLVRKLSEYLKIAPVNGVVVATDSKRDLAVCRLDALPAGMLALPLAAESATRGNKVYSMGNSSANTPVKEEAELWRPSTGKVEFRYFDVITFQKPPKQKVEANTIRTTLKTAGGDSGGPVVNTDGHLVGVHSNGDKFSSFSIDVGELKTFLERVLVVRRIPDPGKDIVGTWTVATTDELGRCYWSLTVRSDYTCLMERDACFEGTFAYVPGDRKDVVRVAVPGMSLKGEVAINWATDQTFSFNCGGKDFTATRR